MSDVSGWEQEEDDITHRVHKEALPCPFCGAVAMGGRWPATGPAWGYTRVGIRIECVSCGACAGQGANWASTRRTPGERSRDAIGEAIEKWNMRTPAGGGQ